jgi:hypothetical protein
MCARSTASSAALARPQCARDEWTHSMKPLALPALIALSLSDASVAQTHKAAIPKSTHDWGCEVLLCLANPAGPTAVAPCVPPIRRLWRELARGRPFPTCPMASGPGGRSFARPASRYYDPCPDGTAELPAGQLAELAAPMAAAPVPVSRSGSPTTYAAALPGLTYAGIGAGDGHGLASYNIDFSPPVKVCVAGSRGTRQVSSGDSFYSVSLFDAMYVSPPHGSPRVIDVYIDNILWHTVRW